MTTMPSAVSSVTGRVSAVSTSVVAAGAVASSGFVWTVPPVAVSLVLAVLVRATPAWAVPPLVVSPHDLFDGLQKERFDAILDVRSDDEWKQGHVRVFLILSSFSLPIYSKRKKEKRYMFP